MIGFKAHGDFESAMDFMVEQNTDLIETVYRVGSKAYFELFRHLRDNEDLQEKYKHAYPEIGELMQTDIGDLVMHEGEEVPLDFPLVEEEELNKPKRGGPKKFYVFVKDPQTGNVKKVTWGDTTGLKVKINDPEARKSFAARHQCATATDKTKASYWACRLPRYAKSLGMQVDNPSAFW